MKTLEIKTTMKFSTTNDVFLALTAELFPHSLTGNPMGWRTYEIVDFIDAHTDHKTRKAARLAMAHDLIETVDLCTFENVRIDSDIFDTLGPETQSTIRESQSEINGKPLN
jgi:hypothetical protein